MTKPNTRGATGRRELVAKISKRTNIKSAIVTRVLEGMVDVIIEDLMETGRFHFYRLFSVAPHSWKGSRLTSSLTTGPRVMPDHVRIRPRLEQTVRDLWKLKQRNPMLRITADTWRQVYDEYISTRGRHSPRRRPQPGDDLYNPFLDEED